MARLIQRGDIWVVDLEPAFGKEIHKQRPAVIISINKYNQGSPYVVIVPISSIIPEVIDEKILFLGKIKGLDKESVLLPLLVRSIDQDRLVKKIGSFPKTKIKEVEKALKLVLGMVELND